MKNPFNSSQNFNELIFENKNKAYGAYALRSAQSDTVAKSMFITFIGISLLVLTAFMANKNKMDNKIIPINDSSYSILISLDPPPLDPPPLDQPKTPEKKVAYSDDLNFKVDDKAVIDPPKANVDLVLKNDGDKKGIIDSTEKDVIIPEIINEPPPPPPLHRVVDEMPELKNMSEFISNNLRYPAIAVDNGTSGTVFLSFVVEKDGSVTDVSVLKGIGDGCEQEAMRVVKMMPKWKPGRNHGELVRVQFNLPVRFKLQ